MKRSGTVIVGAGGFGRETIEAMLTAGSEVVGCLDDAPSDIDLDRLARLGIRYLGTVADLRLPDVSYLIAIADPLARRRIDSQLTAAGFAAGVFVDPAASVGVSVTVAPGCIVMPGARVTTNVILGRHVHLHVNSTVGHDSILEDFVSVYPNGSVAGATIIGADATIGSNGTVLQGLKVESGAIVGAGAVVIDTVPAGTVVKGVPAR
jgi:sugar O-acyltransferase (sialic acid O-acetyltransferase NeuD family)